LSTESSDNDTATFSSKQPIYLRVGIENLGSAAVGIAPALGTLSLRVTNLNGSPVQRYPCPISDTGAEKFNPFIGSGQVRWDPLPYPFTCFEYKMSPGTYIVTATANIYAATKQYPYGTPNAAIYATPVSNSITLSIQ
jgi:hypothetical protein